MHADDEEIAAEEGWGSNWTGGNTSYGKRVFFLFYSTLLFHDMPHFPVYCDLPAGGADDSAHDAAPRDARADEEAQWGPQGRNFVAKPTKKKKKAKVPKVSQPHPSLFAFC